MDNLEEKTNGNTSPAGEDPQSRPDPIIQARDKPGRPAGAKPPPQIVPSRRRVADETLLTPQFMGAGGPTRAVPSARDIIESMLRFKWTALVVFVLVAGPAIAAIWTQVIPQYQARAEVRVRPIIPRLVFRTDENGMIPLYDSFVNTQVSIMRSLTVLQRVLDQQEVQKTQWYTTPSKSLVQRLRGSLTTPMERLRDDLSVQPRSRTEIIDVSFMARSDKDAKLIVDAVLDQYKKYTVETFDATEDELYRQLADQYRSLENEIQGREQVCAELRRSLRTETPAELISAKRIRLDETQASLAALRQKIAALELQVKQAVPDDPLHKEPKYYEDEEWRKLDIDVKTIRHNIDNSVLTDKNPDAIRAHNDLAFAEELLRRREAQLDEQWRDRLNNTGGVPMTIIGAGGPGYEEGTISVENQLAQAKQQEQLLLTELEKQKIDFDGLFETAQLLEKENTALLHTRELFDAVRQRRDQKNMERNVPGSIAVQMWAFVPSRPYNDRRMVFTAMALVMGLGMGGGAAFLRAGKNQAVYTARDMPHTAQVPFLGYIPETSTRKSTRGSLRSQYDEILLNQSCIIEAIRVVRTALLSRLDGQGSTAVLVTSAAEGTGKSTFTLMLGRSLAQVGKKVVLIDADFHKMTLTRHFKNLSDKSGFIQSLRSRSVSKEHIFQTETRGLSIVGAGQRGNDNAALEEIANGAVKTCIGKLRKEYDIILLDGSPILPLADATILAGQVDGTILVERELVSRRPDILSALIRLGSAGGRLLGTVFVGSGRHDKYGYTSYYGRTSKS